MTMTTRSLLIDHLSSEELAGLSDHDRALICAVTIVTSEDRDNENHSTGENGRLVAFECIYCSSSPLVSVPIKESSALFNKVFPGSVESIGASLRLLRDKHFSAEAAKSNQRCAVMPFSVQQIFDRPDRQGANTAVKAMDLKVCCDSAAHRLGIRNKSPGLKAGVVFAALPLISRSPSPPMCGPCDHEAFASSQGHMPLSTMPAVRRTGYSTFSPMMRHKEFGSRPAFLRPFRPLPSGEFSAPPASAGCWEAARAGPVGIFNGGYLERGSSREAASFAFIYDGLGWTCPHCSHLPFHLRSEGSYCLDMPTPEFAMNHLRSCTAPNHSRTATPHQHRSLYLAGLHGSHLGPVKYEHAANRRQVSCVSANTMPMNNLHKPPGFCTNACMLSPPTRLTSQSGACIGTLTYPSTDLSKLKPSASIQQQLPRNEVFEPAGADVALVLPEDKLLLTDYFYSLNQQLRLCRFTEKDRRTRGGKRKDIPVGYGGIACLHCYGKRNARKFFWSDVDRLANSFSEIPAHVMKCASCPEEIKAALTELKPTHSDQMTKLPRGWQKVFFRRMWRRIHGHECPDGEDELEPHELAEHKVNEADATLVSPPYSRGACLLAIPEDKQWLSDLDCFIRTCLEVFAANSDDVQEYMTAKRGSVQVGRIGIRCIYCAASPQGACGEAVIYPFSVNGIYEAVREIQKLHFDKCCPCFPDVERTKLLNLKTSSSLSSVLRRYYVIAAKALNLGLYDTDDGIRAKTDYRGAHERKAQQITWQPSYASPLRISGPSLLQGYAAQDAEEAARRKKRDSQFMVDTGVLPSQGIIGKKIKTSPP